VTVENISNTNYYRSITHLTGRNKVWCVIHKHCSTNRYKTKPSTNKTL